MPRLYFTGYACCGLSAAIPHAGKRVHTGRVYALGMRQHGASAPKRSVARSTPTAPRSKQERPKNYFSILVLAR